MTEKTPMSDMAEDTVDAYLKAATTMISKTEKLLSTAAELALSSLTRDQILAAQIHIGLIGLALDELREEHKK